VLGDPDHVRVSLRSAAAIDRLLTVLGEITAAPAYGEFVEAAA
jgi:hypothetical protein